MLDAIQKLPTIDELQKEIETLTKGVRSEEDNINRLTRRSERLREVINLLSSNIELTAKSQNLKARDLHLSPSDTSSVASIIANGKGLTQSVLDVCSDLELFKMGEFSFKKEDLVNLCNTDRDFAEVLRIIRHRKNFAIKTPSLRSQLSKSQLRSGSRRDVKGEPENDKIASFQSSVDFLSSINTRSVESGHAVDWCLNQVINYN